jgi:hypothetical protein
MKKKIAFVLVMVMLGNMIAWADDSTTSSDEDGDAFTVLVIIGGIALFALLIGGIFALIDLAEADAPDDGIRLASMRNAESVLQHVEFGQAEKDKFYVGFRFRF